MRVTLILFVLAWTIVCLPEEKNAPTSPAAAFSIATDREEIVSLAGKWRFQPGDDPVFAEPKFDDSGWKLLESTKSWSSQGYKGMSGLAWYRFRITLPAGSEPMALYLPQISTCYQVFADGSLLQTVGRMPPEPSTYRTKRSVLALPVSNRMAPQAITVAVRVWHNPIWAAYTGGGPEGEGEYGSLSRLVREAHSRDSEREWRVSMDLDIAMLEILASIVGLALYLLRRSEREYLWFALMSLCNGLTYAISFYEWNHTHRIHLWDGISGALECLFGVASLFFYCSLLRGRRNVLFWVAVAAQGFSYCVTWALFTGHIVTPKADVMNLLLVLPSFTWILLLLFERLRGRLPDARLLILPLVLSLANDLFTSVVSALRTLGLSDITYPFDVMREPIDVESYHLVEILFLLAVLAILLNRFSRTSREHDRTASELEAARSLQHVLIPESIPPIPGLTIATAYHPAQEVGGDFFQVLPQPEGETLIVLGDVSGKGLGAAMTVSLIVGSLRSLAETTNSPALLLAGLNRRLWGRGAGFTTCIILRVAPDRTLTISNAGHLSPYVNGIEMETEASLPLGLLEDAQFQEQVTVLSPGDRLTLLTDGVPEATRKHELFGFERTQKIAAQVAGSIADVARSFGQTDDITVLTIDFLSRSIEISPVKEHLSGMPFPTPPPKPSFILENSVIVSPFFA